MKTKLLLFHITLAGLLNCIFFINVSAQNTDSVYYFNPDGTKEYWYVQKDMYAFRMVNGQPYTDTYDAAIVEKIDHTINTGRKLNEMHFKNASNETGRTIEKDKVRNHPNFECEFSVLTKNKDLDKSHGRWHTTNDHVLVTFRDNNFSQSELQQFKNKHDLILDYQPSNKLPDGFDKTYVFRLGSGKCGNHIDAIETAKQIWLQDNDKVKIAEPGIRLYKQPEILANNLDNTIAFPNGAYCTGLTFQEQNLTKMWHIDNDGTNNVWGGNVGTADADADLCECWKEGFWGDGIKVAVIDFYGFEFSHEDMIDRFLRGYNFVTGTPINGDTYTNTAQGHGQAVSSVVAAIENNNGQVIGAAPHSKIIPLLFDGYSSYIVRALDSAMLAGADVINMSWGGYVDAPSIRNKIKLLDSLGRPDPVNPTITYGCVMVASAGNDDSTKAHYPSANKQVIGVGGTNPNDKRGKTGDGWGTWYDQYGSSVGAGSNHGAFYTVVAPGALIRAADLMGTPGVSSANWVTYNGTSFAAPIVSGIAAMMLSKNKNIYARDIKEAIKNGAEKVNPAIYDYNANSADPGRNSEMQYGRVSCINSLNLIALGVKDISKSNQSTINAFQSSENKLTVKYDIQDKKTKATLTITDMLGKEIMRIPVKATDNDVSISIETLPKGMYIVEIHTENNNRIGTQKFIRH